jgi:hypothetical protein
MFINFQLKCKNCKHDKSDHYSLVENPNENQDKARAGFCKRCDCANFEPEYTKEYANQVYNEFLSSFLKTKLQCYEAPKSGKKIEIKNIDKNELNKKRNIEKELKKCLEFLSKEKLINLIDKIGINEKIYKILLQKYYKKNKIIETLN